MRTLALILVAVAATLLVRPASPQDKVRPSLKEQKDASAKKISEFQKERIDTLKQMAEQIEARFNNGRESYGEVLEARLLVLEAELDTAEKETDRITIHKKIVDTLKSYETQTEAKVQAAQVPAAVVLKLKARRLEAEIHLEQEKIKEAKERK